MIIKIKNLKIKTIIGLYKWEDSIDREIIINVEIDTDFTKSLVSDDIVDAIDYDLIIVKIRNVIAKKRFKLVEKMAQEIIDSIMEDHRIKRCRLEIDKVGAVKDVESFSVTIEEFK